MLPDLPSPPRILDLLPDAVCIVDADGRLLYVNAAFQRILGYPAGEVLGREIFELIHPEDRDAQRLQRDMRPQDLVARIGGDEFVVILPDSDLAHARRTAEDLRLRLRAACVLREGALHLDASVGIACHPRDGQDADALLAHADRAMYASRKRDGEVAGGEPCPLRSNAD